ncbi:hypothetical protein TNIN_49441 [Trichonephila inaurata madagascariensis]|uniref:Uncharacterized protein n=1 Tax=Trichonephila inaurata madagascariensis TaxID=2747483 RepID=A0A8X6YWZ8_9ARAC|nr:hypothetical protein TNIN_49441 [Trichonephila inaurata madagascariensis]
MGTLILAIGDWVCVTVRVSETTESFNSSMKEKCHFSDRPKPAFMEIDDPVPAEVKPVQLHPGLVQC